MHKSKLFPWMLVDYNILMIPDKPILLLTMPLFGKSSKNPGEVVRQLKESLMVLEKQHNGDSQKKFEKAHDDVRNCPSYF